MRKYRAPTLKSLEARRSVIIWARVKPINKKWLLHQAKELKVTVSPTLDLILDQLRVSNPI